VTQNPPTIKDFARTLAAYNDEQWLQYNLRREPLASRLTDAEKHDLYFGAVACGQEQAATLRGSLVDASVPELAESVDVKIALDTTPSDGVFTTFATYSVKDGITIYADNARATDALIQQEGLEDLSGGVKTEDLLLAHELFHYVENHESDLFIQKKHVLIFRLGPIEYRSKLLCLSEVAAMAFAQKLTGLPCSPYVFDVVMLYAKNPQRAKQQFDMIQSICEQPEDE